MSAGDFVWSVKNGENETVMKILREPNFDVNELIEGRTALHYAADYGHTDVIATLLQSGADIDKKDKHGITPVLAAIWESHVPAVKLLLSKGANKNGSSPDGQSYQDCAETDEMKAFLMSTK